MSSRLSYAQLLETNNLITQNGDETYWLCVTRTVQESKLFPVPAYMMLSYAMAFYRYPALLRKIESRLAAEDLGDRARQMGAKLQLHIAWCLPCFYLLGREWLINLGLARPQDAVDDVVYVLDFWKRFMLAWHRNDGHFTAAAFNHRNQYLPERTLQVFEADMYDCRDGDPLHHAALQFTATVSQYTFLIHNECRLGISNNGPYALGNGRELLVRDFMDLAEGDFPWMDGVAADVPFNNLTVPIALEGTHIYILDEWSSFEGRPEFRAEHVTGVGLYTSDALSEGYLPVGMNSAAELTKTYNELTAIIKDATTKLWKRQASWSRDQMLDAGAITYFSIAKDIAHVAGVYDVDDWMKVDVRADRLRPLLNDEYGRDVLGSLIVPLSNPSHRWNEYTMMMHSDGPTKVFSPIPYSILADGDHTATVGEVFPGITYLPPKEDRYRTTRGVVSLAEYNRLARAFTPQSCSERFRWLDDTWVKYNHDTPLARELYNLEQRKSRVLAGAGASLLRADIQRLRAEKKHAGR